MSIDLSALAAPDVVEALDYESILTAMTADLQVRDPAFSALVESDPAYKILEVAAYREFMLRGRVNDAASALLLAKATGSDLDHIAATYYEVTRLLVDAGDPNVIPPIPATYESNERLRQRCTLSLYARSTAGPKGAYIYHAMSASAEVLDVGVQKHTPVAGDVTLTLLSTVGNGVADQALIDTVQAALDDEEKRPLNDTVIVQSATIVNWALGATLTVYPDANTALVLQLANAAAAQFATDHHAIGHDINLSALHAVLHVAGVQKVAITDPAADVVITDNEAPFNTGVTIAIGGTGV